MRLFTRMMLRLRRLAARLTARLQESPVMRCAVQTLLYAAAGFFLSGAVLLTRPVPLALALQAALPFGVPAVGTYLAAAGGYLFFWGFDAALEPMAVGFLLLAGRALFHDLLPKDRRWFVPVGAASLCLPVGLIYLIQSAFSPFECVFLALRAALLGLAAAAFGRGLEGESAGRRAIFLALAAAALRLQPMGLPVGLILLGGAVFRAPAAEALRAAVLCGLTADVFGGRSFFVTAGYCLGVLLGDTAAPEKPFARALILTGACLACQLFAGNDGGFALCTLAGALGAMLLPAGEALPQEKPCPDPSARLLQAAGALESAAACLQRSQAASSGMGSAAVYDGAAEQVCSGCARWRLCWEQEAAQTYVALFGASDVILARGQALPEDLPAFFRERCCQPERFLAAVNAQLRTDLARRQYAARMQEARQLLSRQYAILAGFLSDLTAPAPPAGPDRYRPEAAMELRCRGGQTRSGDRAAAFRLEDRYFLMLLDGMGSGEEAAREAERAEQLLRQLLLAGVRPPDALECLNCLLVLRELGGAAAVDLLQVSLESGEGVLYKWGAAVSYFVRDGAVQVLGEPSPPPGIGLAAEFAPRQLRVSFRDGGTLVMVTDGAAGAETERFLAAHAEDAAALAAGIADAAQDAPADDRTAAVLRLLPVTEKRRSTPRQSIDPETVKIRESERDSHSHSKAVLRSEGSEHDGAVL